LCSRKIDYFGPARIGVRVVGDRTAAEADGHRSCDHIDVTDWKRMRASENWTPVLRTRFCADVDYDRISAFLDGLDEIRSTMPVARLQTDFRARTLTILMESPSSVAVETWRIVVAQSGITGDVENA
jgi:hypothetical protein